MAELIVALDLPTAQAALALVRQLDDVVDFYKVGAPLYTAAGPQVVGALKDEGKRVFLDLKYHDIPNTVARASESAAALGVDLLTLHASGGSAMMRAAREAVGEDGPRLLGVTVLTSFTAEDVVEVWDKELRSLREEVVRLAGLSAQAGLDGVVASAMEVEGLKRRHGADFMVVTPGIRPAGTELGDQARSGTPAEAARAGADYIVVGRPVYQADDPAAMAQRIVEELVAGSQEAPE